MATAFQSNAFQNNAFQIDPVAAGGVIVGGTFSRKRWRKLQDEIAARQRAAEQAREEERQRQLEVARATRAAAEARANEERQEAWAAWVAQWSAADLDSRLGRLRDAASGAVSTSALMNAANTAVRSTLAAAETARREHEHRLALDRQDDDETVLLLAS